MAPKDYYSLLQLRPGASLSEVKQAYRKLAKRYHPDRNPGDPYAQGRFQEIHEAYGVLSDPKRKERYDREQGIRPAPGPLTPEELLVLARQLQREVEEADWGRMDKKALLRGINDLLARVAASEGLARSTDTARHTGEPTRLAVLRCVLKAAGPLEFRQAKTLEPAWVGLAGGDSASRKAILDLLNGKKREFFWKRWSVPIFLAVAGLLCYLMYRWGR